MYEQTSWAWEIPQRCNEFYKLSWMMFVKGAPIVLGRVQYSQRLHDTEEKQYMALQR
ncbi:hypothetical protein BDR05DRAFT_966936 [Suillus weaverae]|nr:hypothetical protein BDR05DRAFT_966936 [Suillus weaverae]